MNDDDTSAALWAAGALPPEEYEAVCRRLEHDPAFARRAAAWERDLAMLGLALAPVAPGEGLLEAIEARIDDRAGTDRASHTVQPDEGGWVTMGPGIRIKVLHRNIERRHQTILLEADPGASRLPHEHEFDEELYVISGDLMIDGRLLGPGDFHYSANGSRHPAETTVNGCTCLIVVGF